MAMSSSAGANCSPEFMHLVTSNILVDKTALILALFQDGAHDVILCTAPRRFGKSVNLTMIKHFLELEVDEDGKEKTTILEDKDNYKLFKSAKIKLKVMENQEFVKAHFGQYPIINLNFVCTSNIESKSDGVYVCREAIHLAFYEHRYLYKSKESPLEDEDKDLCKQWCGRITYKEITDDNDILDGLMNLVKYLNEFHKREVYIIVDEYDSIISNALYHIKNADSNKELEELEITAKYPIQVVGKAVKRVPRLIKGVFMTGILDLAGIYISTLLGNVLRRQFGTNNLCQDFYGFTEDEVSALFDRCGVDETMKNKAMAKYNGYVNGNKKPIYNPQSVVQFLQNISLGEGALKNYWQQSGYIHHLYQLFREDNMEKFMDHMIKEGAIQCEIEMAPFELSDLKFLHNMLIHSQLSCKTSLVIKFLVSLGYLTYSENDEMIKIPNTELVDEFKKRLHEYFFFI